MISTVAANDCPTSDAGALGTRAFLGVRLLPVAAGFAAAARAVAAATSSGRALRSKIFCDGLVYSADLMDTHLLCINIENNAGQLGAHGRINPPRLLRQAINEYNTK